MKARAYHPYNLLTSIKSIHQFQSGVHVSDRVMEELVSVAACTPSTWNLQHWKFVLIRNEFQKERLQSAVYFQPQLKDCSVAIVVLGDVEAYKNADDILNQSVRKGYITSRLKEEQLKTIMESYASDEQFGKEEAIRNASMAAMQLMLAARDKGLDTCVLRFDSKKMKEVLHIPDRYLPVMVIALGYAAKAPRPTHQLHLDQLIIHETF